MERRERVLRVPGSSSWQCLILEWVQRWGTGELPCSGRIVATLLLHNAVLHVPTVIFQEGLRWLFFGVSDYDCEAAERMCMCAGRVAGCICLCR